MSHPPQPSTTAHTTVSNTYWDPIRVSVSSHSSLNNIVRACTTLRDELRDKAGTVETVAYIATPQPSWSRPNTGTPEFKRSLAAMLTWLIETHKKLLDTAYLAAAVAARRGVGGLSLDGAFTLSREGAFSFAKGEADRVTEVFARAVRLLDEEQVRTLEAASHLNWTPGSGR